MTTTLQKGKYQTRIGRIAILQEGPFQRTVTLNGQKVEVTVWKGVLCLSNGQPESAQEWQETNMPRCLGQFVHPNAVQGVPHQFDLDKGPLG